MRRRSFRFLGLFVLSVLAFIVLWNVFASRHAIEDSAWAQDTDYDRGRELLDNPGFENGNPPSSWSRDMKRTGGEGDMSVDTRRVHGGRAALKLTPNKKNNDNNPLAVSQLVSASDLGGRRVEFSGYVQAEGGATAVLAVLSIVGGAPKQLEMSFQPSAGGSDWVQLRKVYDVPTGTSQIAMICMVNGRQGAAYFDDLSLVAVTPRQASTPRFQGPAPSNAPASFPANSQARPDVGVPAGQANIVVDASRVIRDIPASLFGTNIEWRWDATSLWDTEHDQVNSQLEDETRALGVKLIRYPGGIYSDFYHWKQGIGARQSRPEIVHEPGKQDKSRPNFGTDEALDFARRVGGELWITVNFSNGTPQEAADWVRYVNSRGERVRFWEIGNEQYINDGSPVSRAVTLSPDAYARRFREFAQAMRAADPNIRIAAIGGENHGRYSTVSYPDWNRTVLAQAGDQIDLLSVHNGYAPLVTDERTPLRAAYRAMLAAPTLFAKNLDVLSRDLDQYVRSPRGKPTIAVTEWGPAFRFDLASRWSDHNKTLGSALYVASAFKAMLESPRTEAAMFWMLNDYSVLGWIADRSGRFPPKPDWIPTARYYALQMYSQHFGQKLITTDESGPTFDSEAVGLVDAVRDVPYLDAVSSMDESGRNLYVLVVNKHFDSPIDAKIDLRGFHAADHATAWTLNGSGIDANTGSVIIKVPGLKVPRQAEDDRNPRFLKGGLNEVSLTSSDVPWNQADAHYSFPAHSVTSLVFTRGR